MVIKTQKTVDEGFADIEALIKPDADAPKPDEDQNDFSCQSSNKESIQHSQPLEDGLSEIERMIGNQDIQ